MPSHRFRLHHFINTAAAVAFASVLGLPPATAAPATPALTDLLLNTTIRHAAIESEPGAVAAARFQIEVPQAGLLALGLTIAGGEHPEPVLRLLDDLSLPTGGHASAAPRLVGQTPTALLVEARGAETLLVEVAALEPGQSLPAFKLRSAFQAAGSAAGGLFAKDVDPWDDDLGPKPPPNRIAVEDELCAQGEQDDHGDVTLCATPIGSGKTAAGILHNDAGDDEDLFVFRLPVTAVITVEVVSDSALQLLLRDRGGLVVAAIQSNGEAGPLRLARALAPGRYFLEVESLYGSDAVYALTLHRPIRP